MPVSAGRFDVALEGEICRPRFHWMEKIMRAGSEPSDSYKYFSFFRHTERSRSATIKLEKFPIACVRDQSQLFHKRVTDLLKGGGI